MTASPAFCAHLIDLMAGFGPVSLRRMFGGAGLYHGGVMFALVFDDTLYFKVDDRNRPAFEAAGMAAFTYEGDKGPVAMSFYEAPPDAMEDAEMMRDWVRGAYEAALGAKAAKASIKARRERKSAASPTANSPGRSPARSPGRSPGRPRGRRRRG